LPDGWAWIYFVDIVSPEKYSIKRGPFGSTIKKSFFVEKGYKVYEQQNAIYNDCKLGKYYITTEKYNDMKEFKVLPGDFIISCSGTIGKIMRLPEHTEKGIINQALLKIRIDNRLIIPEYFQMLFQSDMFQKRILKDTRGVAITNIASVKELKVVPTQLPSLSEQQQIVKEIESRFATADKLEKTIEQSLKQAETLRQSILKSAFEGKLVPQNPKDPTAEELLKKIREEKRRDCHKPIKIGFRNDRKA